MANRIVWEQEPNILAVEYIDTTTTEDIETVMTYCLGLADERPMYFLVDFTRSHGFEAAVLKAPLLARLIRHPNSRWFVFVGVSGLYRFGVQVGMRFAPFKVMDDRDAGVAFLRAMCEVQQKAEITA